MRLIFYLSKRKPKLIITNLLTSNGTAFKTTTFIKVYFVITVLTWKCSLRNRIDLNIIVVYNQLLASYIYLQYLLNTFGEFGFNWRESVLSYHIVDDF